jgi:hypothetical protein
MHDAKSDGVKCTEEQLYEAIHRLCHFVPVDSGDDFSYRVQEFLVQHAMARIGVVPLQPHEVCKSLENLFGLGFELGEVVDILKRLRKSKKIVYSKGKYHLVVKEYDKLQQSVKYCERYERQIIDDWLKSMESKHPDLSRDDLQRLEKDLMIYAAKIFVQHGAKCANLIYAEQEKIAEIIDSPEELLHDAFPEYPVLDDIRSTELPAFFIDATGERRTYIAELLDSSFMLHAIQIDKTCSMLVTKALEGCLLYLDTNVLYVLFGLHTRRDTNAIKRLLNIARDIGYIVVVSTKTIKEYRSSLNFAAKNLKKFPEVPEDLANVASSYSEGGFISTYWRKHSKTNISPEDFIATYRNPKRLLAQYNIKISDDWCAEVQDDPELKNQIDMLYTSEDPVHVPDNIAEHDAFHRLLIKKLRGGEVHTFSDASAWFLTFDKKLNRYDYFARHSGGDLSEVPFCISCDDLLQLIRPLLPRTNEDLDKTFINLLSSPYFRSYREVPIQLAEKILSRIAHFEGCSPDAAAKILTDIHFMQRLEWIDDENELIKSIDKEITTTTKTIGEEKDYYKKLFEESQKTVKRLKWGTAGIIWIFIISASILVPWANLGLSLKIFGAAVILFGLLAALNIPLNISIERKKISNVIAFAGGIASIAALIWLIIEHSA